MALERDEAGGAATYGQVAQTTAAPDGAFSFTRTADKTAVYRARVNEIAGACLAATSASATVKVSVIAKLAATKTRVRRGRRATLKTSIVPCAGHQGDKISLQKKTALGFKTVGTKTLSSTCVATFRPRIRKTTVFRTRYAKQDADHEGAVSNTQRIRRI